MILPFLLARVTNFGNWENYTLCGSCLWNTSTDQLGIPKCVPFCCDSYHWQMLIKYFYSDFPHAPYSLCVTHFLIQLSHAGNFDSLSAHNPKLTSEAYQKILFLSASDPRTWTLGPLSFIKTNFQILWKRTASRVLISVFLNRVWPQP